MTQFQQVREFILGKLEKGLPGYLSYHNKDHTLDVLQATESIANHEGVTEYDKRLLLTAALFHDSGFLKGRFEHETESCAIAGRYLPGYNYQKDEIELICGMIRATRVPQSPQNHLEKILCDADLDYLGRDDFFLLSNKLFSELKAEGMINNENEWNREQADFMESHHYYTATSINLRNAKKEHYIELIKSKI